MNDEAFEEMWDAIASADREEMVPVTGNTYPVRKQIAEMGGKWDKVKRVWLVPASKAAEAQALAAAQKEVAIKGNAYSIRKQLVKMNGKFDKEQQCWVVPAPKAAEAQALADSRFSTTRNKLIFPKQEPTNA